jgi:peptide deformylase
VIQQITTYPTQTGFGFGGTVRHFDETLTQLLSDLKETCEANHLDGLAAFQIDSPFTVMVIKQEGEFLEIINPAIFHKEGKISSTESTAYFPNLTAEVERAKTIKLMYENSKGEQQFLTAHNELAILIQRKVDYLMGSSFLVRLSKEEKALFEQKLENNSNALTFESCPVKGLQSDKILNAIKYGVYGGVIALISKLFLDASALETLKSIEYSLVGILFLLVVGYFFYAQYEGKKYKTCTSCQLGNIAAMTLIKTIHILGLFLLSYWLL